MTKAIKLAAILLAVAVHCTSDQFSETDHDHDPYDMDTSANSFDTYITIRIIDRKGKFSLEALKRDFQCLDKIRPVVVTCLEEKMMKALNVQILFLQPSCAIRVEKFKAWANDTCDDLILFSYGTGTSLDSQSWFYRFLVWLRGVFNFLRKSNCQD